MDSPNPHQEEHMSDSPTEATPRSVVLAILGQQRNGWMISYYHASGAIARAVADGRISTQDIMSYPQNEYPEEMSASLARTAGLLWRNDNPDGDAADVDAEDIAHSVAAIRAIIEGDAGIQQGTW
jgi:hypothetical protein